MLNEKTFSIVFQNSYIKGWVKMHYKGKRRVTLTDNLSLF